MIILLKRAYDAVLENYDVIVMPTLPYTAPKLPTKSWSMMGTFSHTFSINALFIDIPMVNARDLDMHKLQMHADAISICVCTGDNPLAIARGVSSHTDAQTIQ